MNLQSKIIMYASLFKFYDFNSILQISKSLPYSLNSIPKLFINSMNFLLLTYPELAIVDRAANRFD